MNLSRSRSWPHPVLSPLNDDVIPNHFDFDLKVSIEYPNWLLSVEALHGDSTINSYISTSKCAYVLHLECKRTYYRRTYSSKDSSFIVSIPGDQLFGVVEASFLVIASQDIDEFRYPKQHEDYRDSTFAISVGEPLAVAVTKSFEAFLENDPILKISSIFDIKKGEENQQIMAVKCEGERIHIILPPHDYVSYRNLRVDPKVKVLLSTTVILPALLRALQYLRSLDEASLAEFKMGHRWSRCLLNKLEEMKIDLSNDQDGEICFDAAQKLLRGPLRRSLDKITDLFKDSE